MTPEYEQINGIHFSNYTLLLICGAKNVLTHKQTSSQLVMHCHTKEQHQHTVAVIWALILRECCPQEALLWVVWALNLQKRLSQKSLKCFFYALWDKQTNFHLIYILRKPETLSSRISSQTTNLYTLVIQLTRVRVAGIKVINPSHECM